MNKSKKIDSTVAEDHYLKQIQNSLNEEDPCWKGYKQYGMKMKGKKSVPNCVPNKKGKN